MSGGGDKDKQSRNFTTRYGHRTLRKVRQRNNVGDNANIVPRKKDKLAADFMPPMRGRI